MTNVRLHGILAKEYGQNFCLNVGRPRNVLHAIDANRDGFIARIMQLQKEGCMYEIIINKKRLNNQEELQNHNAAQTIDLVPTITGFGFIAAGLLSAGFVSTLAAGAFFANIAWAVVFAAVAYALTPAPEVEQVEGTARANKQSQIFSNNANVASQGAPLPLGYGRLKVGSQVIQACIKSYPQNQRVELAFAAPTIEGSALSTVTIGQS